ncbi:MAG: gluconate 2-dehydrogenase subunit 3 family protein [Advenella sp.]
MRLLTGGMMDTPIILRKTSPAGALTRREFLRGAAILTGTLAASSVLATFAPSRVWALETTHLNQVQAETLLAMGKALYPHKDLPDAVYALLVKDMDAQMGDSAQATLVAQGVAKLNQHAAGAFASLALDKQTALLQQMQADPFFQAVRGQCITSIYDNDMAYRHFGYEGEVWSKGGYLARGFDDLKWLPDPPQSASPSMQS